jgi:hypothetical protein
MGEEQMKGYRTIFVNGLVAFAGIAATTVEFLHTFDMWDQFVPPAYLGPLMLGLGIANIWLRLITNTAVFRSAADPDFTGDQV